MTEHTYLGNAEVAAIDELYKQYLENPENLDNGWRKFFEGFDFAKTDLTLTPVRTGTGGLSKGQGTVAGNNGASALRADLAPLSLGEPARAGTDGGRGGEVIKKEFAVMSLINGYRTRGHLFTKTNPVRERRHYTPTLDLENFGLSDTDLETVFHAGAEIGIGDAKLKDIVQHLDDTYCRSVGAEYRYIRHPEVIKWLEDKMESSKNSYSFSIEDKRHILQKLNEAVAFENFLQTKFVGQKRFSLEGAETTIPALDAIIEWGANMGIKEFVIGMAHRGRLNVLANTMNKSYEDIFSEFEGKEFEISFDGDVKYHLGYSSDVITSGNKKVHLSLTPNPSHLEAVDPLVQGIVRAKIDNQNGSEDEIAAILIHGDAAIAAQGIVYEVVQMSLLDGYRTGGTIHLVINNQIGFTTNYIDARSSTYCTDVAKVTLSPVFHVNGDDVEAVVYTVKLAMEYRQKFHRDVFIDILCYRKYGHNEGDEPRFTQPLLYKAIAAHANPREIYNEKLLSQGDVEANLAKEMEQSFRSMLQRDLDEAKKREKTKVTSFLDGSWNGLRIADEKDFDASPDTAVDKKTLLKIGERITQLPQDKKFFNKISKLFNDRTEMLKGDGKLDWAMGELLAYGTLLEEGNPVRVSGQDVERGTFSHRHAVVRVEDSEEKYVPLNNISDKQSRFYIYNSLLSEYGVLGFDYGYAFSAPNSLIIWEAQFGDFGNGAQIIIDQYLSCAEDKWRRMNGLVMFLPHGYEGQGAEHSSARLERFLSLSAENNLQIVNCTTPANFFHVLRRQLKRDFRKPLIVFTPKSLLRHPKCVSTIADFSKGGFKEVIDDANADVKAIKKIVFCSGKLYYDLLEKKETNKRNDVALIRIEQLYPFPKKQIDAIIKKYNSAKDIIWTQEEPENMGAYTFLLRIWKDVNFKNISRPESASPATGSHDAHDKEQKELVERVFE
ncbi:MAG: 2-oxoglutarate dehydrogenase E1 component [Bacteroidia bacterium]